MSVTAIARRYAQALADVATSHGDSAGVEEDLAGFVEIFESSKELVDAFASPVVPQSDKLKILNTIIERAKPGTTVKNLLRLLLQHYRLQQLRLVYDEFRNEMNKRAGILPAKVTTASPVADGDRQVLGARLEQLTGKRVQLDFKIDPEIIGGVVTRLGSVVYDGSVKTRLETIRQNLKTGGAAPTSDAD
ncbi:MAG: ATP synthase F1 subunit delta [Blastocatellia bacterium]